MEGLMPQRQIGGQEATCWGTGKTCLEDFHWEGCHWDLLKSCLLWVLMKLTRRLPIAPVTKETEKHQNQKDKHLYL
jgi:hypothetical protein